MRLVFAALLACAVCAPASALPISQSGLSAPSASVVQVKAKGGKPGKAGKSAKGKGGGKCAAGAICPLVGGGDY